jgi:hypothetical protein
VILFDIADNKKAITMPREWGPANPGLKARITAQSALLPCDRLQSFRAAPETWPTQEKACLCAV